jgi:transposase-like protein
MNICIRKTLVKNSFPLTLCSAIALLILLVPLLSCDYEYTVKIKNETDQTLTVYIRDKLQNEVKPGETIKGKLISVYLRHLFVAKDMQGNILYTREFTKYELGDMHWKIVIRPSVGFTKED